MAVFRKENISVIIYVFLNPWVSYSFYLSHTLLIPIPCIEKPGIEAYYIIIMLYEEPINLFLQNVREK